MQALWVPIAPRCHSRTFDHDDHILLGIGFCECPEIAVQVIKGDIDQLRHAPRVIGYTLIGLF